MNDHWWMANRSEIEAVSYTHLMIDTGSNVSIISTTELERIQRECGRVLPTLPLNNVILLGATGRQNKTIRRQVSANVISCGIATVSYTHLDVYKRQPMLSHILSNLIYSNLCLPL